MATYVLVHGLWHGGWCWRRVAPLLREAGHEVFTPTLTGLGERAHLSNPEIDLDTHTRDVLGVLRYEDLDHVILVGNSYAGMVITAVIDQAAERIAHLVYLDAFIPQDGQSMADFVGPAFLSAFREQVRTAGEGWRLPALPLEAYGITDEAYGITDEDDRRWMRPKLVDQPFKTVLQSVRMTHPSAADLPRTFIYCNQPAIGPFDQFAERARTDEGWCYRELAAGHFPMITAPRKTADLLLELA
jgi:pimeloyl-ACP methyl ester carboxylesterase